MGLPYAYRISGLDVASEIELLGAIVRDENVAQPDVTVRCAPVPATLGGAAEAGPNWELDGETFLLRVPKLARFLVVGGGEITVELEPGATAYDAAGFVLGTSFGILLHQRGALVLHGAAVSSGGRAMAICGPSGAGKSTLAAALCGAGCNFVTDDICAVSLDHEDRPVVLPDGRQLKLWKQSIKRLDLAERQGGAVREGFEKYFVAPHTADCAPPRLSAIYILREARPPLEPGIEALALPDAVAALDVQAYRPGLRARMSDRSQMLAQAAAMLGHTKVFMLTRPHDFAHLAETVARVREHWDALG